MLTVELKRGKSKPFWLGHPWVFSGAIHKVSGPVGDTGGPCVVLDERGNVVGSGFYNPHGKIAVRILEHRRTTERQFEPRPLPEVVQERLTRALKRREGLQLATADTNVFRLVNSEGDLLPGLIVDRLGESLSIQLTSRAMYEQRDAVRAALFAQTDAARIAVSVTETSSQLEAIPVMHELYERGAKEPTAAAAPQAIVENGVRYSVELGEGQKTGFYADQRSNRRSFAAMCKGEEVLDLYSYVGAFSLNALVNGGATSSVAVDSSKAACEAARANAALNGVEGKLTTHDMDAVTFMKEAVGAGKRWSRIVCDPPKLARGRGHLQDALKKYARINTLALSLLTDDGLLLTCSCSQHVDPDAFLRMLTEAGHRMRKTIVVHETWSQPADHPTISVAPEGRYLKAYLVSVA